MYSQDLGDNCTSQIKPLWSIILSLPHLCAAVSVLVLRLNCRGSKAGSETCLLAEEEEREEGEERSLQVNKLLREGRLRAGEMACKERGKGRKVFING